MFQLDPSSLVDSRTQLHWAAQLLSAAADAMLDHADDDSHSNLAWNASSHSFVGRAEVSLRIGSLQLVSPDGETFSMNGQSLDDSRKWLSDRLGKPLALREYEMPDHAVANGTPFHVDQAALGEISQWFSLGQSAMESIGESRIWPHHLDMGWLIEIDGPQTSIGGGLSPGDNHYDQPYFYVNPYGATAPGELPELKTGRWAPTWTGAVLTAGDLGKESDPQSVAASFLNESTNLFRTWYSG